MTAPVNQASNLTKLRLRPKSLLDSCDISRLFGGGAQAAHIDALSVDVQSFARVVGLAGACEVFFHGP